MVDEKYTFSNAQKVTADGTTEDSTNQVDLGDIEDDRASDVLARGRGPVNGELRLIVSMGVLNTSVGTSLAVALQDATATGGSFAAVSPYPIGTAAIAVASLVAGFVLMDVPLPRSLRRALKLVYTTVGDWTTNQGTLNAFIYYGHQSNRALAS